MMRAITELANLGWLETNLLRDYPVAVTSRIPQDLLADVFAIAFASSGGVMVSSVMVSEAIVSVWFALDSDPLVQGVASIPLSAPKMSSAGIRSPGGSMTGSVVFGNPASAVTLGFGRTVFDGGLPLETRAFIPAGKNLLSSLSVENRTGRLDGEVLVSSLSPMSVLAEGQSLVLTLGGNDHMMLADCQGEHVLSDCSCTGAIYSINGVTPDHYGNINLIVEQDAAGIIDITIAADAGKTTITTGADRDRFCSRIPVMPDIWGRVAPPGADQNPPNADYLLPYGFPTSLPGDSPPATEFPEAPTGPY